MPANTAADWSTVANRLREEADRALAESQAANSRVVQENLSNGNAPIGATSATVSAGTLDTQTVELEQSQRLAQQQADIASEAPSITTAIPAPANRDPGNNTDVEPFVPANQAALISPEDTGLTARRVVLPPRPVVSTTTEISIDLPLEPTVQDQVTVTPITDRPTVTVVRVDTPESVIAEQIQQQGQFDGVSIPREQQTPSESNISLAPSEIAVPINTPPFDEFAGVNEQAQRNAELGELGINTDILPVAGGVQQARASNIVVQRNKSIDWRFRISLSETANYLYKDSDIVNNPNGKNHLLYPLLATNGVIFPYTPKIDVTYQANYDPVEVTHSNYKFYNYKNSSVENISISGDFTAQDTYEANYMLAVIHFFRSVTKMFYGKDQNPAPGVPPPLCYLNGHGTYAFNNHPCVITSFSLNYPQDVDYVNARIPIGNADNAPTYNKPTVGPPTRWQRQLNLYRTGINTGGIAVAPVFRTSNSTNSELTRVPSKLTISISALPIVTRNDLSNNFSLKGYASGELMLSSRKKNNGRKSYGGFW